MPNLKLALAARVTTKRAKPPTRLERIRSSISIWQIAIAVASALVAITLVGVATYRLKGRTDDESSETGSTSTSSEPNSTSTNSEADSTSTNSGNDAAPGNENPLTDTVQKEMFHKTTGPN